MTKDSEWSKCLLGDVVTLKRGYDLPSHQRREGLFPIVSSSGVSGYHVEAKVKGPGVVTGRYGTLGEVFFIRGDFWPLNTSLYVQDFKGNDRRFISYFLRTLRLDRQNIAGAVPGVNRNALHMLPVRKPPVVVQRRMAAILSVYDDLIENNTRRIKILEEMARMLYREWFAHFRFPGHERVKLVDSRLGKIPEVWEVRQIGDVIETVGGGTPSTKNAKFWDGGDVTWFTPSDLTAAGTMFLDDSGKKITKLGLEKSSARLFPAYSVMMTSRATIGVVAMNTREACTNQGFITCVPNDRVSAYQIYFWIFDNREKIIGIASGATYKEINRTEFRELPIIVADGNINERFAATLSPICKQIENLQAKTDNLRRTRDLLLPKLISGEIPLKDNEKFAKEIM